MFLFVNDKMKCMEESIKLVLEKISNIDSNVDALALKVSEMDAKIKDMDDKTDTIAIMVKNLHDKHVEDSEKKETEIKNIQKALDETRERGMRA